MAREPNQRQGWSRGLSRGASRLFWNPEEGRLPAGWRILLLLMATLGAQIGVYVHLARSLGWADGTTRFVYILTAFGVLLLALRVLDRRAPANLGFAWRSGVGRELGWGLGFGLAAVVLVFGALWAAGWLVIRSLADSGLDLLPPLATSLGIFALAGLYEEALCRGYLLRNVAEGLHGRRLGARGALVAGWIVSSLLFGLMHAGNPDAGWLGLVNVTLLGAVFALPYLATGSLAVPVGLHVAWNFFSAPIFGLLVSGTAPADSLLTVEVTGPEIWTGAGFGPEGGLLVTLTALLLAGALVLYLKKRAGGVRFRKELAQPPSTSRRPDPPTSIELPRTSASPASAPNPGMKLGAK